MATTIIKCFTADDGSNCTEISVQHPGNSAPAAAAGVEAAAPAPASPAKSAPPATATTGTALPIPGEVEEITAEWLGQVLHEGRHIPPSLKVVSLAPIENIGEGRGYANYSYKITATYNKSVNPDIPQKFVYKVRNKSFAPFFPEGEMRLLANKFYQVENMFYELARDSTPVPLAKLYWSATKCADDGRTDWGDYGILMEWLGDDLKAINPMDGVTKEEMLEACEAAAKLHARWWNSDEISSDWEKCSDLPAGSIGMMNPEDIMVMLKDYFGVNPGDDDGATIVAKFLDDMARNPAFGPKFAAYLKGVTTSYEDWAFEGRTKNSVISSFDMRETNMIWRRNTAKPSGYECVLIDHQAWIQQRGAIGRDIGGFLGLSVKQEDSAEFVPLGIRKYWDTLCEAGISDYSWDDCQADFVTSAYAAGAWALVPAKALGNVKAGALENPEGSELRKEGMTMYENMKELFDLISKRALAQINTLDPDWKNCPVQFGEYEWFEEN